MSGPTVDDCRTRAPKFEHFSRARVEALVAYGRRTVAEEALAAALEAILSPLGDPGLPWGAVRQHVLEAVTRALLGLRSVPEAPRNSGSGSDSGSPEGEE